ncbi:hypothetical protein [Nocardia mexicana]|nr:hypothetical protein [Nocardia mexicana]
MLLTACQEAPGPGPSADIAGSSIRSGGGPELITASSPGLFPEGAAWDPHRRGFLIGSTTRGNVSVVGLDGSVSELVPSLGAVSTLGIEVDPIRNRIYIAYSDYELRKVFPTDQPPVSGVAVVDLITGGVERKIDTALGRADTFANDLAVDTVTGSVYLIDCVYDTVQVIDPAGSVRPLVSDPRFRSPSVGLNGIVWHPDGYLVTGRYDTGALFRISLQGAAQVTEVATETTLRGIEGFTLRPDGTLLMAQNRLGVTAGVDAVTGLRSEDDWRTARVVDRTDPWPVSAPTSVAFGPFGAYALSGQVDLAMAGRMDATAIWLRHVPF